MRTTMKDIARECKVSVATVSIALSGSAKKGRISESKLEEIRQTARRLNYFPNSSASNLARGRSKTIGVVINDIRNSHIAELDTAISEVLQERGYSCLLYTSSIIIPCHRVVGTNGSLTGYAGGIDKKIALLELEHTDISHFFVPKKGTAL